MGARCGTRDKTFRLPWSLGPFLPRGASRHRGRPHPAHERHRERHRLPRPARPPVGGVVPGRLGTRAVRREHRVRSAVVLVAVARRPSRVVRPLPHRARFHGLGGGELRRSGVPPARRAPRVRPGRPRRGPARCPVSCSCSRSRGSALSSGPPGDRGLFARLRADVRHHELHRERTRGRGGRDGLLRGRGRARTRLPRPPRPTRGVPHRSDLRGSREHVRCIECHTRSGDRPNRSPSTSFPR